MEELWQRLLSDREEPCPLPEIFTSSGHLASRLYYEFFPKLPELLREVLAGVVDPEEAGQTRAEQYGFDHPVRTRQARGRMRGSQAAP